MLATQPARRWTLALALYRDEAARTRDDLAEMLIKRMQGIHKQGKAALDTYRTAHAERTDDLITTLRDVVLAFSEATSAEARVAAVADVLGDRTTAVLDACNDHLAYVNNNYLPFLWTAFRSHRTVVLRILHLLTIRASNQDTRLEAAIAFLLRHAQTTSKHLIVARESFPTRFRREAVPLLDLSWIPDGWWRLVTETQSRKEPVWHVDRRQFTVCLVTQIVAALKTGDLYVVGSDRFADPRAQELDWATYHEQVDAYGALVGLPTDGAAFVAHVKTWLAGIAQATDDAFPDNEHARVENGRLVLKRTPARATPAEQRSVQQLVVDRQVPINILDALTDTVRWLNWPQHCGPISGFDAKIDDPLTSYLVTTFCYGCQLGPAATARALGTLDRRHIAWVNQRHISIDTLDRAIEQLIRHFEQFALARLWGSPKRAAADGMKWELWEQNLLAENYIRYGGYGGVGYYHVADTYSAIFANLIACGRGKAPTSSTFLSATPR